jgi:hypothetical protein
VKVKGIFSNAKNIAAQIPVAVAKDETIKLVSKEENPEKRQKCIQIVQNYFENRYQAIIKNDKLTPENKSRKLDYFTLPEYKEFFKELYHKFKALDKEYRGKTQ